MKVKAIGTGSIFSSSNSACYLIDKDILIDMPNGTCKNLINFGVSLDNINHILFTHFHGDHYFDISFYLLSKLSKENNNLSFYLNKEALSKIKKLTKLAFPNTVEKIKTKLKPNYIFDKEFIINEYKVKKVLVDHGNIKPAYGYIFYSKNKTVGFTGDTTYCNAINKMAQECDYLICDCNFIAGNNKHMGIDNIVDLANKYEKCIFVTSHMNDDVRIELKKLNIKNIIIPKDGDNIL